MHPSLCIGNLRLDSCLLLAPLAGYTDWAFRTGIRELGGLGLCYTEMLNPRSVMYGGGHKRDAILATDPGDRPLGWQLYGSDPVLMAECAAYLCEIRQPDVIDINMGCPQRKIAGRGDGAALLRHPDLAKRIARAVAAAVRVPVTVKLRIGWDSDHISAPALAAALPEQGIRAITVHGRTAKQKYTGTSNHAAIREVVQAVDGIPVIGNGDVLSPQDAERMLESTGCSGVMIGRGALRNPWIFKQAEAYFKRASSTPPVSRHRHCAFMLAHLEHTATLYGSGNAAKLFRKWLPHYAAALDIPKPRMVELMQYRDIGELRCELKRSAMPS